MMSQKSKRLLGIALGMSLGLGVASSWADFTSVDKKTVPASVSFTEAGVVSVGVQAKNIADNSNAAGLGWSGVTIGATGWKMADQYIQLTSVLTQSGSAIQFFTDNKNNTPAYSGTGVAAGLVDNTNTTVTLPLAWSIKDDTSTPAVAADPNNTGDLNSFQWKFAKDPGSSGTAKLVNGEDYARAKDSAKGMHFGQAPSEYAPTVSPDVIYVETDFTGAVTPRSYNGTIRLEAFTE